MELNNKRNNNLERITLVMLFHLLVVCITHTALLIHFPRFQLVFDSQLEQNPKVIMPAVECARLFILDQIH